jgi:hypothetical protein
VLVVLQELKVGYVPVFQTIVEDQSAETQYALSTRLFNNVRYNGKNIGMGNAKESYAEWNNNIYFVDPFRSEPIRAGLDGIDTISGKMSKYFKKVLQEAYEAGKKIIGYYDIFYNEYSLSTETVGDILVYAPFNTLEWQLDDTYVIPPADISITTNGTKGVATYNSTTGIATYTPNNGETGSDNFTFSFTPSGGVLTTKRVCLTIEDGDDCPIAFSFVDVTDAQWGEIYVSNPILIDGIDIPSPISITGAGQYRINGVGSWLSTPSTVVNGDFVEVRITSSASPSTAVSTTLTVGCQSDTYTVTTAATTTTTTTTTTTAAPTTTTTTTAAPTTTTTTTTSTTTTTTTTTTTEPPTTTTTTTEPPTTTTTTTTTEPPEPTTTTTTTTTAPREYRLYGYSTDNRADACSVMTPLFGQPITVYAASNDPMTVTQFFNNNLLTSEWTGVPNDGDWVSFSTADDTAIRYVGNVDFDGNITNILVCDSTPTTTTTTTTA